MVKKAILYLISFYSRYISPRLPSACRHYPTCSDYLKEAVQKHGALRGSLMGLLRLLRCNRMFKGGYDPVP